MAARTNPPGLQLSWSEGHAYAWQPGRGAGGGNLHEAVARVARRPSLAWGHATRLLRLHLPEGAAQVMCQQLDSATLATLGDLDVLRAEVSPSVAWFGALHHYATDLVVRGRITNYEPDEPTSFSGTGTGGSVQVTRRQLSVTIAIEMVANKDGRMIFQERSLSARGDYEPGREADGRKKALEFLVNSIVDKAQSRW